ncbi:hypothetical protein [Ruegeria hyattellae]|uniref:hypothetical protein n=1 Tax=Ruegeria hyattellae TaxID=3233337 RepID=UPI00355B9CC9
MGSLDANRSNASFHARHDPPFVSKNDGYDGADTQILVKNGAIKAHFNSLKHWQDQGLFKWYGTR